MQIVLRIAAIGLVVSLAAVLLKRAGREDIASLVTLAGLLIAMAIVINMCAEFFSSVQSVFGGYWQ